MTSGLTPAEPPGPPEDFAFGDDLLTIVRLPGEGIAVPIRPICQALGLDAPTQIENLQKHDVLLRGLRTVRIRTSNNQLRPVMALLHKYLPFWFANINPAQVNAATRPKLVRYQEELVEVLDAIYGGTLEHVVLGNPAPETRLAAFQQQLQVLIHDIQLLRQTTLHEQAQLQMRVGAVERLVEEQLATLHDRIDDHTTITGPEQEILKRGIQRIAQRYEQKTGKKIYDRLFAQFCQDLGTPRYNALPAGRYADALQWLQHQAAHYLPDDPEALPPLQNSLL